MTQISIQLHIGENYISFPESSNLSFREIFTDSGIINNVVSLHRYDSILQSFVLINIDTDTIKQGRGYILIVSSSPLSFSSPFSYVIESILTITYNGIPFSTHIDFNTLRSMILANWNLIGTDTNIINVEEWCRCIDAQTGLETTTILPKKSYWIRLDECKIPSTDIALTITVGIFLLYLYDLLRSKNTNVEMSNVRQIII